MPSTAETAPAPRLPHWVIPAGILFVTLLAYISTAQFQFVYDDGGQIVVNTFIRQWKYFPAYFQTHVWAQFNLHATSNYYRPIFLAWLLINYKLFGLSPAGWHVTTVLAHLVVTYAVYLFALRLTGREIVAAIAALLFGVHPVHLEAVAWISGVTEPLFAMLFIPSFLCHLNFRDGKGRSWMALSLLLFTIAQFSKETAAMMAALVGIYELLFPVPGEASLRPFVSRVWRGILAGLPYAAITLFYIGLRVRALGAFSITNFNVPWQVNLLTIPELLFFYLKLLFWPVGLSAFYDIPYVTAPTWSLFWAPLLVIAALAAVLAWIGVRNRSRTYVYLLVWTVLPLLPVLTLKYFVQGEIAHDRYLYLPSAGFCVLIAMALGKIPWGKLSRDGREPIPVLPAVIIAVLLLGATIWQSTFWANNLLLYKRGVDTAPNNNLARTDLANALIEAGHTVQAMNLYREVLQRDPNFWLAAYNIGYIHYKSGQYEQAENDLLHAIQLYPTDGDEFYYLGLTEEQLGRLDRAQQALEQALRNEPRAIGYRLALGRVLKKEGKLQAALEMFRGELAKNPGDPVTQQEIADTEAKLKAQ